MKKYICITIIVCWFSTFAAISQGQFSSPKNETAAPSGFGGKYADSFARKIDYAKITELAKSRKWEQALQLLRSYSTDDDIYFSDFNDVPNHFRSPKRKFLIAQYLVQMGKKDEARKELRSFFEVKLSPRYVDLGEVVNLLIDLETATDYEEFEAWMDKYLPARKENSSPDSMRQITSIKKEIEAGHYEAGYEVLRTISLSGRYGRVQLSWRQEAVLSYFKRHPQSLDYLLQKLASGTQTYPDASIIYCVGEMAQLKSIPLLRDLKTQVKNFHILNEIIFALAKSGDTSVIPDLYERRNYPQSYIRQHINFLLSRLAGISFGEIKNGEDAQRISEQWKQWIDANVSAAQ